MEPTSDGERSVSAYSRVPSEVALEEPSSRNGAPTGIGQCTDLAETSLNLDDFVDYETYEECLLAFAQALSTSKSDVMLVPSWLLWQKVASYLADHYDDAPTKDAGGEYTKKVKLLRDQIMLAVHGADWKKRLKVRAPEAARAAFEASKLQITVFEPPGGQDDRELEEESESRQDISQGGDGGVWARRWRLNLVLERFYTECFVFSK